jgi:MFS family permease
MPASASFPADPSQRRAAWAVLIAALLGWLFDGFEMGLFPVVAPPALLDLVGPERASEIPPLIARITAAFLVGAAAGGALFGWLGDRIGRVRALSLSILTYSLCTGLGALARTPQELGATRFLAALGMGGEWSLGVALVMETWPEIRRPLLAGLIGAAANLGFLLLALIARQFPVTSETWRWMFVAGAAPALLVFFVRLSVPESRRWQAATRERKAAPLRELLAAGLVPRTLLAVVFASIPLVGTWAVNQWAVPAWVNELAGPSRPGARGEVALLWALGATVGSFSAPLVGARIGRRPAYFALSLASLGATLYLFRANQSYDSGLRASALVAGLATAAFYGWLPLYLPELFPTRVRATAQGLAFNLGRILAAIGAIQGGELVRLFGGDYARAGATMAWIYAAGLVVIWLGPETRGGGLPP